MGIGVSELIDTLGVLVLLSEVLGVQDAKIMKRKMIRRRVNQRKKRTRP